MPWRENGHGHVFRKKKNASVSGGESDSEAFFVPKVFEVRPLIAKRPHRNPRGSLLVELEGLEGLFHVRRELAGVLLQEHGTDGDALAPVRVRPRHVDDFRAVAFCGDGHLGSEGADALILDLVARSFNLALAELPFQIAVELLAEGIRLGFVHFQEGFLRGGIRVLDDGQFGEALSRALGQQQDVGATALRKLFQHRLGENLPVGGNVDGDVSRFLGGKISGLSLSANAERESPRQNEGISETHTVSSSNGLL